MRSRNFGPLFIVLSAMLWSLCGIFTKAVQWDPVSVCTVRGIVALPVIAAVCRPFPLRLNRTRVNRAAAAPLAARSLRQRSLREGALGRG